jgi:hypothetical protein
MNFVEKVRTRLVYTAYPNRTVPVKLESVRKTFPGEGQERRSRKKVLKAAKMGRLRKKAAGKARES